MRLNRAMIGSLLYLTVFRPDIMFSVCLCAIFYQEPREAHLTVVKHIFIYLIGTCNLGLQFQRREGFMITSFYDTNYVGDKVERKNTIGSYNFIDGNLVHGYEKSNWLVAKLSSQDSYQTHHNHRVHARLYHFKVASIGPQEEERKVSSMQQAYASSQSKGQHCLASNPLQLEQVFHQGCCQEDHFLKPDAKFDQNVWKQ